MLIVSKIVVYNLIFLLFLMGIKKFIRINILMIMYGMMEKRIKNNGLCLIENDILILLNV